MPHRLRHNRGSVLGITIMTALICGIAAYAVLQASISEARHSQFTKERVGSRYLAEAAIVQVREMLWQDPAACPNGNMPIDTNGDGVPGTPATEPLVEVTITDCGAGNRHTISAKVAY